MNLIDSSVWIEWIRGAGSPACRLLGCLLQEETVCITPLIVQEVVQGARSPEALRELENPFTGLPLVYPRYRTHLDAAALYARCRWRGITVRSAIDCLIAALAVEHELPLLSSDRDFMAIAGIEPRLKLLET